MNPIDEAEELWDTIFAKLVKITKDIEGLGEDARKLAGMEGLEYFLARNQEAWKINPLATVLRFQLALKEFGDVFAIIAKDRFGDK